MGNSKWEYLDLDRLSKIQMIGREFQEGKITQSMFMYRLFLLRMTKEEWAKFKKILNVDFDISFKEDSEM